MKKLLILMVCGALCFALQAHHEGHGGTLKTWKLLNQPAFKAGFVKYENDKVWLLDAQHQMLVFDMTLFTTQDKSYILDKHQAALMSSTSAQVATTNSFLSNQLWLIISASLILLLFLVWFTYRKTRQQPSLSI